MCGKAIIVYLGSSLYSFHTVIESFLWLSFQGETHTHRAKYIPQNKGFEGLANIMALTG